MTDAVWQREEVESPCVNLCLIHTEAKICIGCYRSADEIARWSDMNPDERRALKADLPTRAPRIKGRRRKPKVPVLK